MAEEIDVGMRCIKYMLFVANFMFVMIGFLLISIGSTIKAIYEDFDAFMASHFFSPATLVIAIGIIIFFVALFGCIGAIKESTCLINLFAFFLTLLLFMELGAAIAAYAMRGTIEDKIRENMEKSIEDYNTDTYDKEMWDFTQSRLHCCGINNSSDWDQYITTPSVVSSTPGPNNWDGPSSCCHRHRDESDSNGSCKRYEIYRDNCLDAVTYIVSESALLLGCGALAVAFIQMLGIIFAWMLAKAVRRLKTQELVDRDLDRLRNYEQMGRGKEDNPTPVLYTPTFSEA